MLNLTEATTFPYLPLLDRVKNGIVSNFKIPEKTILICLQHITETTGSLITELVNDGIKPSDIFILGKNYSTNYNTFNKLQKIGIFVDTLEYDFEFGSFQKVMEDKILLLWKLIQEKLNNSSYENILIIDDGGRCISSIPSTISANYKILSIEQTTKGLRFHKVKNAKHPVISVASSFMKTEIESKIIANGIFSSINRFPLEKYTIGIIGLGNIGKALLKKLTNISINHINTFDANNLELSNCESLSELVSKSDFILGCTGFEVDIPIECLADKNKIFASCSSEDVEFKKIIKSLALRSTIKNKDSSPDLIFSSGKGYITLLHSGYPVNFRNGEELEPLEHIQLTRTLLYLAVVQGVLTLNDVHQLSGLQNLSISMQEKLKDYLKLLPSFDAFLSYGGLIQ